MPVVCETELKSRVVVPMLPHVVPIEECRYGGPMMSVICAQAHADVSCSNASIAATKLARAGRKVQLAEEVINAAIAASHQTRASIGHYAPCAAVNAAAAKVEAQAADTAVVQIDGAPPPPVIPAYANPYARFVANPTTHDTPTCYPTQEVIPITTNPIC